MNRLSIVAGAAAAFLVTTGWSVLQSAPVEPTAADKTLGMALMSALVDSNGTVRGGTGVTSVTFLGTGNYRVFFERSVRDCTFSATVGGEPGGATYVGPYANAGYDSEANAVRVYTFLNNTTGFSAIFHLLVFCHK